MGIFDKFFKNKAERAESPQAKNPAPAASPSKKALPTCWAFACYDRDRVQAMAMFRGDFYTQGNVIGLVRKNLKVPDFVEVKYVEPNAWGAPDIKTTSASFECNMDDIDSKVNAYLVQHGYSADKPRNAMKTTLPFPSPGLLIVVVNMLP